MQKKTFNKIRLIMFFLVLFYNNIFSQVDTFYMPSAKNIDVNVNCRINKEKLEFKYLYNVSSTEYSSQLIDFFMIENTSKIKSIKSPLNWNGELLNLFYSVISWSTFDSVSYIQPQQQLGGFDLESSNLPGISKFFIRGFFEIPTFPIGEEPGVVIGGSIFDNSLQGYTIGPKVLIEPFYIDYFLDTLIDYNQRSYELGWITNEQTYNKYKGLIITTEDTLLQNDTLAARQYLQDILREVDIDSSSTLTSEAYALLRYNTEYLLEQIPEPQPIVKLLNSAGSPLTGGVCQYYEGGWKTAMDNSDGTFSIETDKTSLSIRMTYAYGTQTLSNVPWGAGPVVFQTVNTQVQLKDSEGNLIDEGAVKYYAGGWREFGTTENGIAAKELLPVNYSFRMTHEFISNDKSQNIDDNNVIEFSTINCIVQVKDQLANPLDGAVISYYSGGWRQIGVTINGEITKELLPKNLTFRAAYGGTSQDKTQDTAIDNIVEFIIEQ